MNTKHLLIAFVSGIMLSVSTWTFAQSSMTDKQVLEYVLNALKSGKDQQTIAIELARRGVTEEQAYRVKSLYEEQMASGTVQNGAQSQKSRSRNRSLSGRTDESSYVGRDFDMNSNSRTRNNRQSQTSYRGYNSSRNQGGYGTAAGSRNGYGNGNISNGYTNPYDHSNVGGTQQSQTMRPGYNPNYGNRLTTQDELMAQQGSMVADNIFGDIAEFPLEEENPEDQIWGHNIFNSQFLTFEPSLNLATPKNYVLGAGDEVIIDIWGDNETTIRQEISPDGNVTIENLGPVHLAGKTIEESQHYLRGQLGKIYAGLDHNDGTTQLLVSLGQARTIRVNVMGEVAIPGTYNLSSFATAFHALYSAGGVNDIGSLRKVSIVRNGRTVGTIDVYDFILRGRLDGDIQLQEGDVVIVPAFEQVVEMKGYIRRPMRYEMKPGETLSDLVRYAGGFGKNAYNKSLRVVRENNQEMEICTVNRNEFSSFKTQDGDVIEVEGVLDRYTNKLEIRGAVCRPGLYQLGTINTVRQLIEAADGLMGDAFTAHAVLQRENADYTRSMISIDVNGILNGSVADMPLQKNDMLYIPSIHDLNDMPTVAIHGQVARPGNYVFAKGMTIEDLVVQAGGLLESAATSRVDVARRIKDPSGENESAVLSETFRFKLGEDFKIDQSSAFELAPYDEIYIRQSPRYSEQQNITIKGEVLFPGEYALTRKNERLSSVIEKAGGLTSFGYAKGARLTRRVSDEERLRQEDAIAMARTSRDSVDVSLLNTGSQYSVGIDLEKALENPGSDMDLVLRDGDVLEIPEFTNTVKISGAVMYPNTVSYVEGKKVRYYIEQAGGFGNDAKKSKAYIVYMNGEVTRAKLRKRGIVEPGCEIIVPMKSHSSWNIQQTMSVATASASLATMVATIANMLK